MTCAIDSAFFFFNDTATTEIYTLSLHDALPIWSPPPVNDIWLNIAMVFAFVLIGGVFSGAEIALVSLREGQVRSEEHTSELQSRQYLVCRLLLEKKK